MDLVIEIEYITASEAIKKVVWMKKFISELDAIPEIQHPMPLYCDNTEAIT